MVLLPVAGRPLSVYIGRLMHLPCPGRRRRSVVRRILLGLVVCLVLVVFLSSRIGPSSMETDFGRAGRLSKDPVASSWIASADTSSSDENNHLLCVIVPYRERFEELQIFAPFLHRFLKSQSVPHRILIINQSDAFRFNRASLINVGWYEALRLGCDYLCMHDVDLLPLNPQLSYKYPDQGWPFHVASPEYHPRYNYTKFIGGIFIITMRHYEMVDGMSNKYWGWGLEDDEFYLRLRDANLLERLQRPANLSTGRRDTFRHVHDVRRRKRDSEKYYNQKEMTRRRDRVSGLKTTEYTVLDRQEMTFGDAPILMINVELACNLTWTPYCKTPTGDDVLQT